MRAFGLAVRSVLFIGMIVLGVFSCAGAPRSVSDEAEAREIAAIEERPAPDSASEEQAEPRDVGEASIEETRSEPEDEGTTFSPEEVTEELYVQTFGEVEDTIADLNEIIASRDFLRWQYYLTDNYRRTYSDPRVLAESSRSAILQRNNITLRSLEDYFRFVVVPSRANVRLDEIVFVDESTVEAIMVVAGERYLVYNLTKAGDRWKIDIF